MLFTAADNVNLRHIAWVVVAGIVAGQTVAVWRFWSERDASRRQLLAAEEELEKQIKLRAVERAGRISIQQAKRQVVMKDMEENGYTYQAIGTVESPFPDRRGTPRQPSLVPAAKGKIRFNKKIVQNAHFKELEQFSHVWVMFVFHNNTNTEKDSVVAKIKPPRLHGAKVGCLSTRSPHRPNNIGLSVCEIVTVGEDFIELRCIDMVDGTPVIDVKPYIPYDVVPSEYKLPMATAADGSPLPQRTLTVPAWVVEADVPLLPVLIPDHVRAAIEEGILGMERGGMVSCSNVNEAVELITQVLRQDIRGVHQGRGQTTSTTSSTTTTSSSSNNSSNTTKATSSKTMDGSPTADNAGVYKCVLDGMEVSFNTTEGGITVTSVAFV